MKLAYYSLILVAASLIGCNEDNSASPEHELTYEEWFKEEEVAIKEYNEKFGFPNYLGQCPRVIAWFANTLQATNTICDSIKKNDPNTWVYTSTNNYETNIYSMSLNDTCYIERRHIVYNLNGTLLHDYKSTEPPAEPACCNDKVCFSGFIGMLELENFRVECYNDVQSIYSNVTAGTWPDFVTR